MFSWLNLDKNGIVFLVKDKMVVAIFLVGVGVAAIFLTKLTMKKGEPMVAQTQSGVVVAEASARVVEVKSGDGSMKLIASAKLAEGTENYTFKVSDSADATEEVVYTNAVGLGEAITVPANSWSPDNKLFFILEKSGGRNSYRVFRADGEAFKSGEKYLDINDYWSLSKRRYQIKEVTGWASPDLLIVLTVKEDGTAGPSFWFVVSSHSFMQLREH
jgi:hypothetical protein